MCLILLGVNPHPRFRLIVAANRDELHARPTIPADYWPETDWLIAGRDVNAGGTWLGITRSGRFAAVTNYKEEPPEPLPPLSRGELPLGFLTSDKLPMAYLEEVHETARRYRGFNLLVSDGNETAYFGNRAGQPHQLEDGCYGLSNQLLDCDWPKVGEGRSRLQQTITAEPDDLVEALFEILLDTGDGRDFSNSFIRSDVYGTRAATVVLVERDGASYFEERNFGPMGQPQSGRQFKFSGHVGA